ncbi:MAG: DNA-directed RNA polymerase subunit P [uncultured DHVE6 group euryarchaeote]|jgi:DNA-directed RNA polymerase subunit RPC12/RpoP|nr:MAG: DNA-directed RNA polymerase subunit P [uncultured DHVE6 group euryarchaeote]
MAYRCQKCAEEIKQEQVKFRVICPYCSSRVIAKQRSLESKPVLAR